ncbi:MAG TPA: bis-aminopropyl spermidine synthase family protein [Caldisericia bacterium]|nr:bis-aminopropyl spermidine synthase family protein [Caldisericia bacterium]HQN48045.1 bis-aminopropyl spermidine synthase family protein [Caldisericia bacterium]HQP00014.1 bis-aminopropyl spermidine synthase family protein [Caldisericia bacterium]
MERVREEILMILSRKDTDFFEIVSKSNYTAKEILDELKKLSDEKIIKEKDGMFSLENKIDKKISTSFLCDKCNGRGVYDNLNFWSTLIKEYDEIAKNRPLPTNVYDQGVIDNESAISRFLYMLSRGDLYKKKIIILGDDDLMGILFSLSDIVDEITVLEIDERLVNYINSVKKEKNLKNIEVYTYDARDPLEDIFKNKFDTFFTDPVETVEGLLIFVSRMVEALKGDRCSGYFGLSSIESNIDKWFRIQKSLNEMNLVITDIRRNFSYYKLNDNIIESDLLIVKENPFKIKNPNKLWYNSHLYRVEVNGEKKPKYTGKVDLGRDLYFDEFTYVVKP